MCTSGCFLALKSCFHTHIHTHIFLHTVFVCAMSLHIIFTYVDVCTYDCVYIIIGAGLSGL